MTSIHAKICERVAPVKCVNHWLWVKMPNMRKPAMDEVINAVCRYVGLTRKGIAVKGRLGFQIRARQLVVYLIVEDVRVGEWSARKLGKILGYKDHTMIGYTKTKANERYETEPDFKADVEKIRNLL